MGVYFNSDNCLKVGKIGLKCTCTKTLSQIYIDQYLVEGRWYFKVPQLRIQVHGGAMGPPGGGGLLAVIW